MVKQLTGTAVQEYTRLMNNQGYSSASSVNSAAIFNPIGSAIMALGGTEQDYNDFSFLTGLVLGVTSQHYSIYKPYYEAYAASRMYGNQVNNKFPNIEYINEPVYNRNIAREAASWQGKGAYPGVDKWREIELKNGTKVIGGLPGQSEFYTTQRGFFRTNGIKTELWEGLQVKASPQFGYRPQVGVYKVISNSEAAFSITKLIHNMGQEVYHKYIFLIIRQI